MAQVVHGTQMLSSVDVHACTRRVPGAQLVQPAHWLFCSGLQRFSWKRLAGQMVQLLHTRFEVEVAEVDSNCDALQTARLEQTRSLVTVGSVLAY